jgi:hypothetical protein
MDTAKIKRLLMFEKVIKEKKFNESQEMIKNTFEDVKGVIRSRKSQQDRQSNG